MPLTKDRTGNFEGQQCKVLQSVHNIMVVPAQEQNSGKYLFICLPIYSIYQTKTLAFPPATSPGPLEVCLHEVPCPRLDAYNIEAVPQVTVQYGPDLSTKQTYASTDITYPALKAR